MVGLIDRRRLLSLPAMLLLSDSGARPEVPRASSVEQLRGLLASGARRVALTPGTHVVEEPLLLPSGATLVGAGTGRTVLRASVRLGASAPVVSVEGVGSRVEALTILGAPDPVNLAGYGVQCTGSGHAFRGVEVRSVAQAGFRLSVSHTLLEDCSAIDCGRAGHTDNHGFMLYGREQEGLGPIRNVVFRRCKVDRAYRKGFTVFSDGPQISSLEYEECEARRCGVAASSGGGFYLVPNPRHAMTSVRILRCVSEANYANFEIGPGRDLTVRGCRSRDAVAWGFLFHGLTEFTVSGNSDHGAGVDAMRFDQAMARSSRGVVSDNVLVDANHSRRGFASYLNLEGADELLVTGNRYGDTGTGRTPFGIYEGPRAGRNTLRDNALEGRLRTD